jgi:predicted nucleic acid-binding protein
MASRRQAPAVGEVSAAYRVERAPERVYVDTSVWIALLAREAPAPAVAHWLVQAPQLCCADWTQLELASAIGIKYRRGDLSVSAAQAICEVFASMTIYQVHQAAVTAPDIEHACRLCLDMDRGLRAGDALHLAVAIRLQCSQFFSFDHNLNGKAQQAGLQLVAL